MIDAVTEEIETVRGDVPALQDTEEADDHHDARAM